MRCAVIGDPVAHSLSPALHSAAYAELGLDWRYDPVRVSSGGIADFVSGLDDTWRGLSVTAPLKREALAAADGATDRARLAGGANTLVITGEGVHADNTDLPGAAAALRERFSGPVERVALLGAGATASSVGLALCDLGAREVTLLARDPGRARESAATLRRHPQAPQVRVEPLGDPDPVEVDVVVSTVPAAAQDPALVARTAGVPVVFEVVYDPWPTPVAAAALADDRVLVAGLDLLVHQAVLQLRAFTGLSVPVAVMRHAGERVLAERASSR